MASPPARRAFVQIAVRPDPIVPDVPVIMDFAHDDRQRQILRLAFTAQLWGRPYVAPPDLPPERPGLRDRLPGDNARSGFLAEAKRMGFDIGPLSGEEMAGLIADLMPPGRHHPGDRAAFRVTGNKTRRNVRLKR